MIARPVERASPRNAPSDDDAIGKALLQPLAFNDLKSFLSQRKKIIVVVNDHTRATPTRQCWTVSP